MAEENTAEAAKAAEAVVETPTTEAPQEQTNIAGVGDEPAIDFAELATMDAEDTPDAGNIFAELAAGGKAEQSDDLTAGGDEKAAANETPTEEAPAEAAAEPTEAQQPESEEGKEDATAAQEPAQPAEATPPEQAAQPDPALTPEQAAEMRQKWLDDSVQHLVDNVFNMSDEDIELFEESPEKVLPKMAATATIHAIEATTQTVLAQIPRLVQQTLDQQKVQQQGNDAFFEAWPQLKDAKYMETLTRIGQTYRNLNPQAPVEQFIAEVGAQAMFALKLPMEAQPAPQPTPQPAPASQPPHVPAGRANATPPPPAPLNEFAELATMEEVD